MRVLFLGAGASHAAGYPLGAKLLSEIKEHMAAANCEVNAKARWSYFDAFLKRARGTNRLLLTSSNPEVVLTYIDLCIEALGAADQDVRSEERQAMANYRGFPIDVDPTAYVQEQSESLQALYDELEQSPLKAAVRARDGFLVGLYEYLAHCHWRDGQPEAIQRREYLKRELAYVEDGDVVVTTNYDTLVERILLEEDRWSYCDGYGFVVPLKAGVRDYPSSVTDLPAEMARPSRVRVLKLHGSYGWQSIYEDFVPAANKRHDIPNLFLEQALFVSMPACNGDKIVLAFDEREVDSAPPIVTPLLAYPSYLKPLGLQHVWEQARIAFEEASYIRVLGASLPPADIAVRMLFNRVRFRMADGAAELSVHDKNRETVNRWREHVGSVVWEERYAGDKD